MKTMNAVFLAAVLSVLIAVAMSAEASCTIGVADGSVSSDGRGLLWKSAMTNDGLFYPHRILRVAAGTWPGQVYDYLGICSLDNDFPFAGLNAPGLSTGNSYVDFDPDGVGLTGNYVPTELPLGVANSVAVVRAILQQAFDDGGDIRFVAGCFPYLDASGEAAMFEIARDKWFIEYSAQDADRAPQELLGWIVRANEFHERADGTDDVTIAGRYDTGSANIRGLLSTGDLSAKTIMQGNDGSSGYEYMRYGPDRPMDTIAAPSVVYSMAVQGVAPGEDPALTTMWIMLGQANYSIAVPAWVRVADVPEPLANGEMALRARSLDLKGQETTTQASLLPAEEHLFDEVNQLLAHWRSDGTPNAEEMTRVEHRMAADAYSLMDCLDNLQDDNQAPAVILQVSQSPGLTMEFAAAASDTDGLIGGYEWVFGDGFVSAEQSPLHTFDEPGWHLVSCTVLDDDGVSTTDWEYINVVPEPCTLLLAALALLAVAAQYGWQRQKR